MPSLKGIFLLKLNQLGKSEQKIALQTRAERILTKPEQGEAYLSLKGSSLLSRKQFMIEWRVIPLLMMQHNLLVGLFI